MEQEDEEFARKLLDEEKSTVNNEIIKGTG